MGGPEHNGADVPDIAALLEPVTVVGYEGHRTVDCDDTESCGEYIIHKMRAWGEEEADQSILQ